MHYHFNYCRYIAKHPLPPLENGFCTPHPVAPVGGFSVVADGAVEAEPPLCGLALIKHALLKDGRTRGDAKFKWGNVREWYGRRKAWPEDLRTPEAIQNAINELVSDGLLLEVEVPVGMRKDGKKKCGRAPSVHYMKRRFSEIALDDRVYVARKALRVHRENFAG